MGDQCDNQSDVQPDVQPQVANDGCAQRATVYTHSGRRVKIPERLDDVELHVLGCRLTY